MGELHDSIYSSNNRFSTNPDGVRGIRSHISIISCQSSVVLSSLVAFSVDENNTDGHQMCLSYSDGQKVQFNLPTSWSKGEELEKSGIAVLEQSFLT